MCSNIHVIISKGVFIMTEMKKSTKQPTRRELFMALLKERVAKQLDLLVTETYFTYKVAVEPKTIYLIPSIEEDGIQLVFSTATFRDAVYGNEQIDLEEAIQSYKMVAATQLYDGESERISFGKTTDITNETTPEVLIKFWCNS